MKLAFHKGVGIMSRMIEYGTHSPYSHVELVFSDNMSFSARAELNPAVNIVPFDGSDGRWDFIEIPDDTPPKGYAENQARVWAESQKGKAYDYVADAGFVLPFLKDDKHKLMCSASCTTALQQAGFFKSFVPSCVSPGQLYVMAKVLEEESS